MTKAIKYLVIGLVVLINSYCFSQELNGNWSKVKIPSPAISNSILKDGDKNNIGVYLPPSYKSGKKKYPVIYFLQGYMDPVNNWACTVLDSLINVKKVDEIIMVDISGVHLTKGSFFINSPVTGNWEDYVLQDVISYVENNYRVLTDKSSRALAGLSMGGYGALKLGIPNTDMFGVIYSISPGLFDKKGLANSQMFKTKAAINEVLNLIDDLAPLTKDKAHKKYVELLKKYKNYNDFEFTLAYGMANAPNTEKAPYFKYPYTVINNDTLFNEKIWKEWNDGFGGIEKLVIDYKNELSELELFVIDCGYNDEYKWISEGGLYYSNLLDAYKIPHKSVWHNGGHSDRFETQICNSMFPLVNSTLNFED